LEFLSTTKSLQWLDNQYSFETAVLKRVGDRRISAAPVCFFSEDPNRSGPLPREGGSIACLPRPHSAGWRWYHPPGVRRSRMGVSTAASPLDRHFDVVNWNQPLGAKHQLAITDIVLTGPLW